MNRNATTFLKNTAKIMLSPKATRTRVRRKSRNDERFHIAYVEPVFPHEHEIWSVSETMKRTGILYIPPRILSYINWKWSMHYYCYYTAATTINTTATATTTPQTKYIHANVTAPITVVVRPKAWNVLARSKAGIVGSNPTQGMDVCVCALILCVGRDLATGWSLVQGVLPSV
jgi:hypothetical protein